MPPMSSGYNGGTSFGISGFGKYFTQGSSINPFPMNEDHELVIAGDGIIWPDRLDACDFKDKIFIYSNFESEEIAKSAAKRVQENGAAGIVIITGGAKRNTWFFNIDCPLPAESLIEAEGNKIKSLVNEVRIENRKMYARIHEAKEKPAEELYVAGFSSRGHNPSSDDIPKPNFTAPGTLLCCARLQEKADDNQQCYKLASGTSYAALVVAGQCWL